MIMEKIKRSSSKEKIALPPHTITMVAKEEDLEEEKVGRLKTRIVHVVAPEVIKTDPANFREVVQKLTGKKRKIVCRKDSESDGWVNMKMAAGKEDEEGSKVRGKLADLDLFVQGLIQCPTLPLDPTCTYTQSDLN